MPGRSYRIAETGTCRSIIVAALEAALEAVGEEGAGQVRVVDSWTFALAFIDLEGILCHTCIAEDGVDYAIVVRVVLATLRRTWTGLSGPSCRGRISARRASGATAAFG